MAYYDDPAFDAVRLGARTAMDNDTNAKLDRVIALLEKLVKASEPTRSARYWGPAVASPATGTPLPTLPYTMCGATAGDEWPPLMNGGVQFNCS